MKVKINPIMIFFIAGAFAVHQGSILLITYFVMTIHECAHLIAALCIGLRPAELAFSPFGVHLTLKNRIVHSLSEEIILYSAGPLANAIMALVSIWMQWQDLYIMNTALMIMNLLPVLPLDGGIMLKRILSEFYGYKFASAVLRFLSAALGIVFTVLCMIGIRRGVVNLSMFAIALLLFANAVTSSELYKTSFINGIASTRKKNNRVKLVLVDESHPMLKAAEYISPAYTLVAVVNDGENVRLIDEKRIIKLLDHTIQQL